MSDDLPDPMTPADCDLRGNDWMPLHGTRLFGSKFYSLARRNPRAGLAGLKLWWEAWMQCPAASLPSDDFDLASLAGFGEDLKAWRAVKDVALHGFVLCSDGRLYHKMLAEEALVAFERRLSADRKQQMDRDRLRRWRETKTPDPNHPENGKQKRVGNAIGDAKETDTNDATSARPSGDETRFNSVLSPRENDDVAKDRTGQDKERKKEAATFPESPARDPEPLRKPHMPRRGDPPHLWASLAESWEYDRRMVNRPVVGGYYLDIVADEACEAAGYPAGWRGDWRPLIGWLKSDISDQTIVAAIKSVADRHGYRPPASLAYFDNPVRQQGNAA